MRHRRPEFMEIAEVWVGYKQSGEREYRDALVMNYLPLVKYVASKVSATLPQNVEQADLVSYGMFGLIDAIEKFDLDRNIKFQTYAVTRIKGSIIDELRSIDWIPRSIRAKARVVEKAMAKLETRLSRAPTELELAAELELPLLEAQSLLNQISSLGMLALDEPFTDTVGQENMTLADTIADRSGEGVVTHFDGDEMKGLLSEAIGELNQKEQLVLVLYYYEGFTLAQIGELIGVTESRVCQLHTKAVMHVRERLVK